MVPYKQYNSIKCSGDMGDIIYLLNFMKVLKSKVLYIDTTGGESYILPNGIQNIKTKFNEKSYDFLRPLLEKQSYISVETYCGQTYDINFNEFRNEDLKLLNLNQFHAKKFELSIDVLNAPWIEVPDNISKNEREISIGRSLRYRNNDSFYFYNSNLFRKKGIFVGIEDEYNDFRQKFNCNIPFIKSTNALELAKVINSTNTFFGNGSLCTSIAIGLGINIYYEFSPPSANYLFKRDNFIYF